MNIISRYDLHALLNHLDFYNKKTLTLDKKFIQGLIEEETFESDMNWIIGYKIKQKVVGDHKNDGQLVEYTFTFINPFKKETILETEMCLMVGWNFGEDKYKIK